MTTICNVNDDAAARYLTSRVLRQAGFEVVEAATGNEALDLAATQKFPVMILDVKLPDVSGFEVCRQLKLNPATASMLVLHVSATFVSDEDRVQGLEGGADAYLISPMPPAVLIATVRALLRLRAAEQSAAQWRVALDESTKQAAQQQHTLEALMTYIPAGITIADAPDATIRMVSRYGQRLTGRPVDVLTNVPSDQHVERWDILKPDGVTPAHPEELPLTRATKHGEVVTDEEWVLRRPDAKKINILCNAGPIRDAAGRITGGVIVWRDITQRKKLEAEREELLTRERGARAEAEAANRAKDEFLATISHELRTPLASVLTWTRLLRTGALDDPARDKAFDAIERGAKAQGQLLEDLLDVSRIISGRLRLDVRAIELLPVIEAAVEILRPALDAKQLTLQLIGERRTGLLAGDPERLQQVVWNLVSNAIKFTPEGGRIQVRLERMKSHLELSVSDTGQGIDPEMLPHVFQRFWQADTGSRRKYGGVGLGLAIVRHLIELHGGTVKAESAGPGQGSTFRVWLPLMATRNDVTEAKQPQLRANRAALLDPALPRLDGVRVLVVDDEPDTIAAVASLLRSYGAEVRCAPSTAEALATLDQWTPMALVSDIGMPEADGYALIRSLRQRGPERGGDLPAIAVTAYARIEDRVNILAAGYQMYVTKPIDPAELVAVVAGVVRTRTPGGTGAAFTNRDSPASASG